MMSCRRRAGAQVRAGMCAVAVLCGTGLLPNSATAYHPKHPDVVAMAKQAATFLEKPPSGQGEHLATSMGGKCCIAQALYAATKNANHKVINEAIAACQKGIQDPNTYLHTQRVYHIGFAISFLTSIKKARPEVEPMIKTYYDRLASYQRPDGGWGYPERNTADTSQTQYAMLALWSVQRSRVTNVSEQALANVTNWLIRTQAPDGAWGYQGNDPGVGNYTRQKQTRVSHSIAAAGAGSLFIAADLLGYGKETKGELDDVFQKKGSASSPQAKSKLVDEGRLRESMSLAESWWNRNFKIETHNFDPGAHVDWQYYYLYGLERFETFREEVRGTKVEEPGWYNAGVDYLKKRQQKNGSWFGAAESGPSIDTAFAVLFLLRTTKEKIESLSDGTLRGGYGLPADLTNLTQDDDGKLVAPEETDALTDLSSFLKMTQERQGLDLDKLDLTKFQFKPEERKTQLQLLKDKIRNEPDYRQRLASVRLLSRAAGNLDNVPLLIFALGDPDWRVQVEARDALRLMSRKIRGFGMPDQPSPEQARQAQQQWERWYRSIRPDARLN